MILPRTRVASLFASVTLVSLTLVSAAVSKVEAAELAVFNSAHCPYCVAWEREIGHVYASTEEGQQAPARRLDIDARRPPEFAKIREIDVTPTFVLVDQGREVGRITGYDGKQRFWADMRRLLSRLPHPQS